MYPGQLVLAQGYSLIRIQFFLGLEPLWTAVSEPDEEAVFYCIILLVFWFCFSLSILLFIVAGFKVAYSIIATFTWILGIKQTTENRESEEEDESNPESTPESKKTR